MIGPNGLLASKARIVVTNSIHFLKHFDHILYIRRGVILESGTYSDLVSNPQCELHKLMYVILISFYCVCSDGLHSKGHGNISSAVTSGMSTPFITGASDTPNSSEGDSKTAVESTANILEEKLENVNKTLIRRKSYGKALIDDNLPTRTASDGPTKEHLEQGRVKREVYRRYLEAASKAGFISFVIATVLQQIASLMGNNMLREWGNHNTETDENEGAGVYLLGYGLFSLSSTMLGAIAALLIWVLCSVRSARKMHDSVRF